MPRFSPADIGLTLFNVRQRISYPRINIELREYQTPVSQDYRLLHTFLKIKNTGSVLFKARYVEVRLRKVLPINAQVINKAGKGEDPVRANEKELKWKLLWEREWKFDKEYKFEIEPGEQDTLHADFIINANVEVIQIYVYVLNESKKNIGWSEVKFVDCTCHTNSEAKMTDKEKRPAEDILPRQQIQQKPDKKPQQNQQDQETDSTDKEKK